MITETIDEIEMTLWTEDSLFSSHRIDEGTKAMISCFKAKSEDRVLDLGCGYGAVAVHYAQMIGDDRVYAADVDPIAVETTKKNAERNGVGGLKVYLSDAFDGIDEAGFTAILANPPYHADFSVARKFIEKGFNRLKIGGRMLLVTKRAEWYKNKLTSVFGGVTIHNINGYCVLEAIRKSSEYAKR